MLLATGEEAVSNTIQTDPPESRTVPPYFHRMEVGGYAYEFGAATLAELLALMRAKGVTLMGETTVEPFVTPMGLSHEQETRLGT